ncbi:DUF5988 family protein [Streptomyces sp. NPDC007851]|uniref:DUF5988 family protein n=1 Tax=Streptomyces sp. NPDC007851 TaxID=3155008 RepID=UPI0033F35232
MNDSLPNRPNAILSGGPVDQLEEHQRIRYVADGAYSVKVLNGNRYEHWVPSDQKITHPLGELRVFKWSHCTYVAE